MAYRYLNRPFKIDLTGQRSGRLTVIRHLRNEPCKGGSRVFWLCRCDCGKETEARTSALRSKTAAIQSCGCANFGSRRNLVGYRSGRLTALVITDVRIHKHGTRIYWLCRCDCGNTSVVRADGIIRQAVRSCGCIGLEKIVQVGYANRGRIHSEEHVERMRQTKSANPTRYWLGKRRAPETVEKMRQTKIANGNSVGPKNPAWNGGVSRIGYPFTFNAKLKLSIRHRDGFKCVLCGRTQAQEMEEFRRALCVNHIDFDKTNCEPSNLNTLCLRCNTSINADRAKWTKYFQEAVAYAA